MGITSELAKDLFDIKELTDEDIAWLRILIIDYFAASFAGAKVNKVINSAVEKVVLANVHPEDSCVFLHSERYSAETAAFMNAFYAHGAELDDGNKKAAGHPGVTVISAVFALADSIGASQKNVLIAIATGYEAFIRISSSAMPGLIERSYHSTGVVGTLACAAACAKLLGLNSEGIENAIALATTITGGILSYGDSRPSIKPLNPGMAARNGLFAALLAKEGIEGPSEALEGPNGWYNAHTDKYDCSYLKNNGKLLMHGCYVKLYPSCRHTHCCIDAAIDLHSEIQIEKIKKINVYVYGNAIKLAGQIKYPKTSDDTKFSIHYTMATALLYGHYGIDKMNVSQGMSDDVKELIGLIELVRDDSMEIREKGIRGARVEIVNLDGSVIEKTVLVPRGDPENPLDKSEVFEKLRICSEGIVQNGVINEFVNSVNEFGGQEKFEYFFKGIN